MITSSPLSPNDLKRGIFHFTENLDKFPKTAIGGSSKEFASKNPLTIRWNGKSVITDIPTDTAGKPRAFFRSSVLTREMYAARGAEVGDYVSITQLGSEEFAIELEKQTK